MAHPNENKEWLRRPVAGGDTVVVSFNTKFRQQRDVSATMAVWQKESFDHIVRSPESLEKFRAYIRAHLHPARPSEELSQPQSY